MDKVYQDWTTKVPTLREQIDKNIFMLGFSIDSSGLACVLESIEWLIFDNVVEDTVFHKNMSIDYIESILPAKHVAGVINESIGLEVSAFTRMISLLHDIVDHHDTKVVVNHVSRILEEIGKNTPPIFKSMVSRKLPGVNFRMF